MSISEKLRAEIVDLERALPQLEIGKRTAALLAKLSVGVAVAELRDPQRAVSADQTELETKAAELVGEKIVEWARDINVQVIVARSRLQTLRDVVKMHEDLEAGEAPQPAESHPRRERE